MAKTGSMLKNMKKQGSRNRNIKMAEARFLIMAMLHLEALIFLIFSNLCLVGNEVEAGNRWDLKVRIIMQNYI
ncbi:hypothetical protein D3C86_877940 [compost metagenome]